MTSTLTPHQVVGDLIHNTKYHALTLQHGEYLSKLIDDIDALTPEHGIINIDVSTGGGKSFLQGLISHERNGAIVYPYKSIISQQRIEHINHGHDKAQIVQLENIERIVIRDEFGTITGFTVNNLLVDEAHMLYTGYYRESMELLHEVIRAAAKMIRVYLFSATIRDITMLCHPVDVVIKVSQPFERLYTAIIDDELGNAKVSTRHTQVIRIIKHLFSVSDIPVLWHLPSIDTHAKMVALLAELGIKAAGIDSHGLNPRNTEAGADTEYNNPLGYEVNRILSETSSMDEVYKKTGVKVVFATQIYREGINIKSGCHIVSYQQTASDIVQEQGRGRLDDLIYHWLVFGANSDKRVKIENSTPYHYNRLQATWFAKEWETKLGRGFGCKWRGEALRRRAWAWNYQSRQMERNGYQQQVIDELAEYGYHEVDRIHIKDMALVETPTHTTDEHGNRVPLKLKVSKAKLVDLYEKHGELQHEDGSSRLPQMENVYNSEVFHELVRDGYSKQLAASACFGFIRKLQIVSDINASGFMTVRILEAVRKLTARILDDLDEILNDGEYGDVIDRLSVEIPKTRTAILHQLKSDASAINTENMVTVSDLVWGTVLPQSDDRFSGFWKSNTPEHKCRLLQILIGMYTDERRYWVIDVDKGWNDLDGDRKSREKLYTRDKAVKAIAAKNNTEAAIDDLCDFKQRTYMEMTRITTKQIKNEAQEMIDTRTIDLMAADIIF